LEIELMQGMAADRVIRIPAVARKASFFRKNMELLSAYSETKIEQMKRDQRAAAATNHTGRGLCRRP
jgi:hypothetical protein